LFTAAASRAHLSLTSCSGDAVSSFSSNLLLSNHSHSRGERLIISAAQAKASNHST